MTDVTMHQLSLWQLLFTAVYVDTSGSILTEESLCKCICDLTDMHELIGSLYTNKCFKQGLNRCRRNVTGKQNLPSLAFL